MIILNPATEEIIAHVAEHTSVEIKAKMLLLKEGQEAWKQVAIIDRLASIVRFGELINENKKELAAILTNETGKPIQQSLNEIVGAQNRIDHLKDNALKWLEPEYITTEGDTLEQIVYEPLGVVANISAWNFPYNVGYNVFLYALVAGNAVMYKPSEYATLTGLELEKYLHQAGVPENVFQSAVGGKKVGQLLLEMDFNGYYFTGSFVTGQHIVKSVSHKMVTVQLELGGKDPLYVMDDVVDVKTAAILAAEGAFYNNGQSCCAVERIYVHEMIYDEFVAALLDEVHSYHMGDPTQEDVFLGALTRKEQLDFLEHQVQNALDKGASLKCGGKEAKGKGYYFEPTVMTEVNHTMDLMMEESFGPIIGIQRVSSDHEAIMLMKDTKYGLTSAVFSQSEARAMKVLKQLDSGTVYWNCCDRVSPNLPWSGRRNSGLGSTLSSQGIRAFVQPKAYHLRVK